MTDPSVILSLVLAAHFIGDFVLQTDTMAQRKSKSNLWLLVHIAAYSVALYPFGPVFTAVNAVAHFVIDWVTSRMTSALWTRGERHWFFVVIGADQLLHVLIIIWTTNLIWRPQ